MPYTHHTLKHLLTEPYKVHDNIYWSCDPDPSKATLRYTYNPQKNRREVQKKIGGEWWVIDAMPAQVMKEDYLSVLDFGALLAFVLSERVHYATVVGGGTFRSINEVGGGLRVTTGAVNTNSNIMGGGDNTGPTYSWNVASELWFYAQFRIPFASDLTNVRMLAGFYRDANNYVAVRLDTAIDPNLFFVCRSGGVETAESIGLPVGNVWYLAYAHLTPNEVSISFNGVTPRKYTANIPTINLTHYVSLQTLDNVAKNIDIRRLSIIQDSVLQ